MLHAENWRSQLGEILDRLGPGAFLVLDETWLEPLFDFPPGGGQGSEGNTRAKQFAEARGCGFAYNAESHCGTFLRAYFQGIQLSNPKER